MKKTFKLLLLTAFAFLLTACGKSLDGTYKGEDSGAKYTLTIKEKDVKLAAKGFLINVKMEGTLDTKKKKMDLTGSFLGQDLDESFGYKVEDGNIILDMDGQSVTFEKEKEKK